MSIVQVVTPERKRCGIVYPATPTEWGVEIVPGKSIAVFRYASKDDTSSPKLCNTFAVGDVAEYDSYNLSYTGVIEKITDKCVTIVKHKGTLNERRVMLKLYEFCWRNHDFDAAETAKKNAETSMYI